MKNSLFSQLVFDESLRQYKTQNIWCAQTVNLNFATPDRLELDKLITTAELLWTDEQRWDAQIRDFACQKLLKLKNDAWLDSAEQVFSDEDFKQRMELKSIIVHHDGAFDFYFDDGDLFWGHAIVVSGTVHRGPTEATIAG